MYGERISGKFGKRLSSYSVLVLIFTLFLPLAIQAGITEKFEIGNPDYIKRTGSVLKQFFKNSKDHYSIDKDIKKIVNAKKEWVLEKEIKNKKIFFKVNGVARFKFRFVRVEGERFIFHVKGQRFVMDHRFSYTNHKNRLLNLLNFRQSVLESLFIGKTYAMTETDIEKVVKEEIKKAIDDPYETFTPLVLAEVIVYALDISSFGTASIIKYGFSRFIDATFGRAKENAMEKQLQCIDSDNNKISDYFLKILMLMEASQKKKQKKGKHISVTRRLSPCLGERGQLSHLLKEEKFKNRFEDDKKSALAVYYLQYCNKYGGRNHRSIRSEEEPVRVKGEGKGIKCVKTRKPGFVNFDWKVTLLQEREKMFNTCREVLSVKMKEYSGDWFNRGNEAFNNCYAQFHCAVAERLNYECICRLPGYSCLIEPGMGYGGRPSQVDIDR